jgi:hypothetical protein
MNLYPLPLIAKIEAHLTVPHKASTGSQTLCATIYDDIKGFARIEAFPSSLSREEVDAELAERRNHILSCPTQGAATCAIDSVLVVARYLGIARLALDVAFSRDCIPHGAAAILRFLDTSWTGLEQGLLNARRDSLQVVVIETLRSIGEVSANGFLDPRSVWQLLNGVPSASFTLIHSQRCASCNDQSPPAQESVSLLNLPDRFISSPAYSQIMSPPSATVIQDLVQLRLSSKTVTVAASCSRCNSQTKEEDTYVADRLPEVLAVGIEGSESGCAHYRHDILIDYQQLEHSRAPRPRRVRYSLAGLLHISGKLETAHITASIRVGEASWAHFNGIASPPIRIFQGDEEGYLARAPQCVMALYKSTRAGQGESDLD